MSEPGVLPPIVEDEGAVLRHDAAPGGQYLLRVHAPRASTTAQPGQFAHIRCAPDLPMRRPLSIMRADGEEGWLEFLYKIVGDGTRRLATVQVGGRLNLLAPIGHPFTEIPHRDRLLLIGGGVGIPPILFLAERLRRRDDLSLFVTLGSEVPFPFQPRPSQDHLPSLPAGVIASMPLLEDWGIPNRLANGAGQPGCYEGYVTDLAGAWLASLADKARDRVAIYACGPEPMLAAAARLARAQGVPAQVALEEYMACGVGGCAGCVVRVAKPDGPAMKRVCVDGPVFDAAEVYPT